MLAKNQIPQRHASGTKLKNSMKRIRRKKSQRSMELTQLSLSNELKSERPLSLFENICKTL